MSSSEGSLDNPGVMEVTGRVLIGSIIALVVVLVLVFLFHIYANWTWHRRQQASLNRRPQDHHHHPGVTVLRRGLDAAFLDTLPLSHFDPKHFKDGLECSVCLSELEAGERTRTLPKCNHVFHAECIDMWFHSHSTCPICRNPVADQTHVSVESLLQNHQSIQQIDNGDSHTFPSNLLFWGDETQVSTLTSQLVEATNNNQTPASNIPFEQPSSSSSSSASSSECTNNDRLKPDLVIDIPTHAGEEEKEEEAGEQTPIMRSLRRILSSSTRFNPFSPRNNVSQQGQS